MRLGMNNCRSRCWRRYRLLCSLLIGGFAVNLLVAWGVMLTPSHGWRFSGPVVFVGSKPVGWECQLSHNLFGFSQIQQDAVNEDYPSYWQLPAVFEIQVVNPETLPRWAYARDHVAPSKFAQPKPGMTIDTVRIRAYDHAAGWPMLSLHGRGISAGPHWLERFGYYTLPDWVWWSRLTVLTGEVLIRPMPLGTAVNTLVYSAILWLMFATPKAIRSIQRGRRIRRDQCAFCNYPRAGLNAGPCPECGAMPEQD